MNTTFTIPSPDEIAERIRACRAELTALRRLHRLSSAAKSAEEARVRRHANGTQPGSREEAVHA
jgi:hypothetical protein